MENSIKNRYDFILLFDVKDGNPNGDPDAGNMPRLDSETGYGLVTDVCIKRKIRNYVQIYKSDDQEHFDIFIKQGSILNESIHEAFKEIGAKGDSKQPNKKAQAWMCEKYFDIRTFGAVLSTGDNAGQVRGPIQLTFGRSIDPILASEHCITRVAITDTKKAEVAQTEMGRKFTISYALYQMQGFISANFASQTGFTEEDLNLFWDAIKGMFDEDHSSARGLMTVCKLIVFKHDSILGNAPASSLFDLVKITKNADDDTPARKFSDYKIKIEAAPNGVEIIEMV